MNSEVRNFILFIIFSCVIVFGYDKFFGNRELPQNVEIKQDAVLTNPKQIVFENNVDKPLENDVPVIDVAIRSKNLSGVISSKGTCFNNIVLNQYMIAHDKDDAVRLLSDKRDDLYSVEFEWLTNSNISLPTKDTVWTVGGNKVLTPETPVSFSYTNNENIKFEKIYSIDNDFVITVTQKVTNGNGIPVSIKPYSRITRAVTSGAGSLVRAYEGPIGLFNGKVEEVEYSKIDDKRNISYSSTGGWVGISDKYWFVSFIHAQNEPINTRFYKMGNNYVIDAYMNDTTLQPNESVSTTRHLFVGAKDVNILDMYEKKLQVSKFDLSIDFGYLYFLTKPLLYILSFLHTYIENLGLCILLLTVTLKLLLFPLANKSYRSMNRMKDVQPKIKALQDMYANDRMKMGQELSKLYKKEKIDPAGCCLPMLLQMPILFALYKVLCISIDMRLAPFYGWIHDLSAPDPMYLFNLFGLIPIELPGFLQIGIWPIIMGLTMWIQQKMSPQVGDPAQAKMMSIVMPVMFSLMFAGLPAGLVIYWAWSNVLGMLQQYVIKKLDTAKH